MSKPQFEDGQTLGDLYWLYVVEFAMSPEFRIYRIQDPARRVTDFLYDDGWSALAEPDDAEPPHGDIATDETQE